MTVLFWDVFGREQVIRPVKSAHWEGWMGCNKLQDMCLILTTSLLTRISIRIPTESRVKVFTAPT
jgi:hypothetical protein